MKKSILEKLWCNKKIKDFFDAPEEFKNNIKNIELVINIFKDDINALIAIANYVDENGDINDLAVASVYLQLIEIFKNNNVCIEDEDGIDITTKYYSIVDYIILLNCDLNLRDKLLITADDSYEFDKVLYNPYVSKRVLNYCAKTLVNNICDTVDIKLYICRNCSNIFKLSKEELFNVKLELISEIDNNLSFYASKNPDVLAQLDIEFENAKKAFSVNLNDNNEIVDDAIIEEDVTFSALLSENIDSYLNNNKIDEDKFYQMLYYYLYKNNLLKDYIMFNYGNIEMYNELEYDCKNYVLSSDINELKEYSNVKKLIKDTKSYILEV